MLENVGFQRQLVELEALRERHRFGLPGAKRARLSEWAVDETQVTVELLVPGLQAFSVAIPTECTIETVKQILLRRVNVYFGETVAPRHSKVRSIEEEEEEGASAGVSSSSAPLAPALRVGKGWLVFTSFFVDEKASLILEEDAVEAQVQLQALQSAFGLDIVGNPASAFCRVKWTEACRFELVIFSVLRAGADVYSQPPLET